MGLNAEHPGVEGENGSDVDVYDLEGNQVGRTGHANVSCRIPAPPPGDGWYLTPPFAANEGPEFIPLAGAVPMASNRWPVPLCQRYSELSLVLGDFGQDAGWRVDQHPRVLADLTGNGCADIIGFHDDHVAVAL